MRATAAVQEMLAGQDYVADRQIAMAVHLARTLQRPLLVEGPAGVGKTEIAKVMARTLDTELIRLQCYEGLDATSALYEWNYQRQLLHIKLDENSQRSLAEREADIFSEDFLLKRPLLQAITRRQPPVLLIDELDRADEPPHVVLTSNSTRELSDAVRRRCFYLWIDYPPFDKEVAIVRNKVEGIDAQLAEQICRFYGIDPPAKTRKDARCRRNPRLGQSPRRPAPAPPRPRSRCRHPRHRLQGPPRRGAGQRIAG